MVNPKSPVSGLGAPKFVALEEPPGMWGFGRPKARGGTKNPGGPKKGLNYLSGNLPRKDFGPGGHFLPGPRAKGKSLGKFPGKGDCVNRGNYYSLSGGGLRNSFEIGAGGSPSGSPRKLIEKWWVSGRALHPRKLCETGSPPR